MGEVSNKTLAALLVATIVVSLGGTFIALNRLGKLQIVQSPGVPVGFATSPNGTVSLTVSSLLSIITSDDSTIDFGTCTPQGGTTVEEFSDSTADTACTTGDSDPIAIRNNGNEKANVTVSINNTGTAHSGSFIPDAGSSGSYVGFKSVNETIGAYEGGCEGNLVTSAWTNFTSTATKYNVCANLTSGPTYNSVAFYAYVGIPYDASQAGSDAKVTFWAANSQ